MLAGNLSYKPLDFGNGLVAGSVNDRGQLVALNTLNPKLGWATLTGAAPFPNDKWYDQAFVRSYRAGLASPGLPAFGYSFSFASNTTPTSDCSFPNPAMPVVNLTYANGSTLKITSFAPWDAAGNPMSAAVQLLEIQLPPDLEETPTLQFNGSLALVRAPYTQLTEGGPIPLTPLEYVLSTVEGINQIENKTINQAVALAIREVGANGDLDSGWAGWQLAPAGPGEPLEFHMDSPLNGQDSVIKLAMIFGFGENSLAAGRQAFKVVNNFAQLEAETARCWQMLDTVLAKTGFDENERWLVRQNLAYNLACCPVPVGDEAVCIITDHQLLPLSWNRDSYWQVQAFLALRRAAQDPQLPVEVTRQVTEWIDGLVRRHLIWLFEVAERPDGSWGRAYLTNGRCKDRVFQLDQQCYPFMELADYVQATGDQALVEKLKPQVEECFRSLLAHKAPEAWLFPTGETPADDKVDMPYNFSSQLTVLRAIGQVHVQELVANISTKEALTMVGNIAGDIHRYLTAEFEGRKMFAYLTDLQGNYQFYHDANDWPTVFAPMGFCPPSDPTWRNTLDFAFSPANKGYFPEPLGGLGSVHSPYPWPLGAIQELYLARFFKDESRYTRTWEKLRQMACWDGLFPEATDANTGRVASRHWFGWPGAMLCLVLLGINMYQTE